MAFEKLKELAEFFETGKIPPSTIVDFGSVGNLPRFNLRWWKSYISPVEEKGVIGVDGPEVIIHPIDGIQHKCDTVCCIGGYFQFFWCLRGYGGITYESMGLDYYVGDALCYTGDKVWQEIIPDRVDRWNATPLQAAQAIRKAIDIQLSEELSE